MISDIDKSCNSKTFFRSKSGAKKAARYFPGMGVYKCRYCPGFHLCRNRGVGDAVRPGTPLAIPSKCKRPGTRSNRRPRVEYGEDDG